MAPRMKHWIGLVAIGMTLVAIWRLPPASFGRPDDGVKTSVELRHAELSEEFRWTAEALRRHRWSDSLAELAVSTADGNVAVALPSSELVDEELAESHRRVVVAAVDDLPRRDPGMVFGYFHQPFRHGRTGDMPYSGRRRTETYVGTRDGVDYCLQVRVQSPTEVAAVLGEVQGISGVRPISDRMGPCRFYLQYGMAGAGIEAWLREGGVGFAVETGDKPELPREVERSLRLNQLFGFNVLSSRNDPIEVDQCRGGSAVGCAALLRRPSMANPMAERDLEVVRRSPAMSIGGRMPTGSIVDDASYLLSDVESEFGAEAFQRFWSSEEDFEVAFERAFGIGAGEWMVGWMQTGAGSYSSTPGLSRSASSGSMLLVGVLLGLAYVRTRKRTLV